MLIKKLKAREILDSRGNPTVECEVFGDGEVWGRASVPSGASTGMHEAMELRDGGTRYLGRGVSRAVANITGDISQAIVGKDLNQKQLDQLLCDLDGTATKSRLGANAILAASLAFARAQANQNKQPLFRYIAELFGNKNESLVLPVPMMNFLNGGAHAKGGLDLQEIMIVPHGAHNFSEALRWGAEVYHNLKKLLELKGLPSTVGDEGGFAPHLTTNEAGLQLLVEAIAAAGFTAGQQISLAIDAASSEFYEAGQYKLALENITVSSHDLIALFTSWQATYPLVSVEDGLAETDRLGWENLTAELGHKLQLVGDDLFVTSKERLAQGFKDKIANAILIKPNQIGTLTETLACMQLANQIGYKTVISHRSGETEDTFIAHLAVGTGAGQIKTGSLSRSERVAKYNELLRIEEELSGHVTFAGPGLYK